MLRKEVSSNKLKRIFSIVFNIHIYIQTHVSHEFVGYSTKHTVEWLGKHTFKYIIFKSFIII